MVAVDGEASAWHADEWDGSWDTAPPWFPPALNDDGPDIELLDRLDELLGTLAPRSANILRRRLGQSPEGAQTLREIGDSSGLSRERIRQVEVASVRKIGSKKWQPSTADVRARLTVAFRSLPRTERGRYLRATFPEANTDVLAVVLETCGPATSKQLKAWIRAFDQAQLERDQRIRRLLNADERWARFARGTIWPSVTCLGGWFPRAPCRAARDDGRRSEKLGRTVRHDSRLEEQLLDLFDRSPQVVDYCEQPFRIDYIWQSSPRVYIPDFAVRLADGRSMLVEAKPRTDWADGLNLAKWDAAIQRCAQRGWGFIVSDNRGHPGDLLAGTDADAHAVLDALTADGPADWPRLRHHWIDAGRSWSGLVATCLRYGFGLLHHPFEVRRVGKSPWIEALSRTAGTRDVGPM